MVIGKIPDVEDYEVEQWSMADLRPKYVECQWCSMDTPSSRLVCVYCNTPLERAKDSYVVR